MAQETPLFAQGFRRAARMGTAAPVGRGAQESTGRCSLEALPGSGSPAAVLAEEGPTCKASPPSPPSSSPSFQLLLSKGLLPEVFLALLPLPQKTLSHGPGPYFSPSPHPALHRLSSLNSQCSSCPSSLPIQFLPVFQDPFHIPPPGSLPECSSPF